jgi:hypothetical protein
MINAAERRAVLGGLVSILSIPSMRAEAAVSLAGKVETARGECFDWTLAARRLLTPDADVFVGDFVGTGVDSFLGLQLGMSTKVRLGAESKLRIDRFVVNAGGILTLDRGAILYDHDPGDGANNMAVRSPFGLMAVRGTRFFAGPSNGVFGVFVERGAVVVVGVSTAVYLTAGLGTNLAAPGAEPTSPAVWRPERVAAAMALFGR